MFFLQSAHPRIRFRTRSLGVAIRVSAHLRRRGEVVAVHVSIRAALTFGRPCSRPARRPPASNCGQRSCLPAAPPSGCCRFSGCSLGSQTLKKRKKAPLFWVHVMSFCFSASPHCLSRALVLLTSRRATGLRASLENRSQKLWRGLGERGRKAGVALKPGGYHIKIQKLPKKTPKHLQHSQVTKSSRARKKKSLFKSHSQSSEIRG